MAITLFTGSPGHGKTTALAETAFELLELNKKKYEKTGYIRKIYSNIVFSPHIEDKYLGFIQYYDSITEIYTWKDCDILIDEMSLYFDSQQWERLNSKIKRYLRLHRHYGVNIYAAVQDFITIDVTVRRLTTRLYHIRKVLSTREPSPHEKPLKYPFSLAIMGEVKKSHQELEKEHYDYDSNEYRFFTNKQFNIFDTRQDIPEIPVPPRYYRKQQQIYENNGIQEKITEKWI